LLARADAVLLSCSLLRSYPQPGICTLLLVSRRKETVLLVHCSSTLLELVSPHIRQSEEPRDRSGSSTAIFDAIAFLPADPARLVDDPFAD
jgi:hypothetical protein